jgi:putative inorganic carbon (hco3(-)) transporter
MVLQTAGNDQLNADLANDAARSAGWMLPAYPEVRSAVTLLFSVYVIIWYLQVGARIPTLGAIRLEFVLGALLAVIAILSGVSLRSPLTPVLALLFVAILSQVPFSHDVITSYNVLLDRVLKFFVLAVFIVAFVKGPRQLRWFLGAFLFACFKMGQEGLVGRLNGSMMWENQGVFRLHGPTSLYTHPNSYAGMALGTLPFVVYLFPVASRWVKGFLFMLALFAGNIILFSGSRTGYVGLVGFLLVAVWKTKRRVRTLCVLAVVTGVALPLVPTDYIERFNTIFTGEDKVGQSSALRREILTDAVHVFAAHPLGVGVSAFPAVRRAMFGRDQDTHNLYLEVATNLGIQGLLVFLLFVGAQLRLLSKLSTELRDNARQLEAVAGLRGGVEQAHLSDVRLMLATADAVQVFLAVRLVLGLFGMDLYEIYWWFAMGLTIALSNMSRLAAQRTAVLLADSGVAR